MLNIYIHYCTKSGFHFTVISQKIRPEIDFEKCNRNFRNPSKSQMLNGNMVNMVKDGKYGKRPPCIIG